MPFSYHFFFFFLSSMKLQWFHSSSSEIKSVSLFCTSLCAAVLLGSVEGCTRRVYWGPQLASSALSCSPQMHLSYIPWDIFTCLIPLPFSQGSQDR